VPDMARLETSLRDTQREVRSLFDSLVA